MDEFHHGFHRGMAAISMGIYIAYVELDSFGLGKTMGLLPSAQLMKAVDGLAIEEYCRLINK